MYFNDKYFTRKLVRLANIDRNSSRYRRCRRTHDNPKTIFVLYRVWHCLHAGKCVDTLVRSRWYYIRVRGSEEIKVFKNIENRGLDATFDSTGGHLYLIVLHRSFLLQKFLRPLYKFNESIVVVLFRVYLVCYRIYWIPF